jgi:SNF2 family DNA or RNA helicase
MEAKVLTLKIHNKDDTSGPSIIKIQDGVIVKPKEQAKLYDHQIDALSFIQEHEMNGPLRGGAISIDMGLGKTRIVLEQINRERHTQSRTLIVCSKTLLGEWINERNKFFPHLNMLVYHKEHYRCCNSLTVDEIYTYDCILTTYDVLAYIDRYRHYSDDILVLGTDGMHKDKIIAYTQKLRPNVPDNQPGQHNLYCFPWKRVVADESQKFCNNKTAVFKAMCGLYSDYRWCLTGTPIRNDDKDMWSLLFFCGLQQPDNPKDWKFGLFEKYKNIIFVKKYSETNIKMPKLIEHVETILFNPTEYTIYKHYLMNLWSSYDYFIRKDNSGDKKSFSILLGLFTRLRQICIAPYLITNESKRGQDLEDTNLNDTNPDLEEWVHNRRLSGFQSSKITRICEIVDTIPPDEKIVIFSSFNSCLDLIQDAIKDKYNSVIVDGESTGKNRILRLNMFRTDPNIKILLCNLRVGSEGLNLPQANHVICVELWWSPVPISQAIRRVWRVGQTKDVHVYTLMIDKSIEENINKICLSKKSIGDSYLYGDESKRIEKVKLDKFTLGQIIGYYKMERVTIRNNIANI